VYHASRVAGGTSRPARPSASRSSSQASRSIATPSLRWAVSELCGRRPGRGRGSLHLRRALPLGSRQERPRSWGSTPLLATPLHLHRYPEAVHPARARRQPCQAASTLSGGAGV
jgi:hypothetical protein